MHYISSFSRDAPIDGMKRRKMYTSLLSRCDAASARSPVYLCILACIYVYVCKVSGPRKVFREYFECRFLSLSRLAQGGSASVSEAGGFVDIVKTDSKEV